MILLGIAAIVTAVALAACKGAGAPLPSNLPPAVRGVLETPNPSRSDLGRAAISAAEAGYPQLASALQERAKSAPEVVTSPWADVSSTAWSQFCRSVIDGRSPSYVDPRGFYGMFRLGVRRLCDFDVMKNPRSRNVVGPGGKTMRVWDGDWVMSREAFLGSPARQYDVFSKSMQLYRMIISERFKKAIGITIDGERATLSGLLGASHAAGGDGLGKWLLDRQYHKSFKHVSQAFKRSNGIF